MSGPLDSESERILLGLAADVQRPEIIWQIAVLLGCLLLAWYLGSRDRKSTRLNSSHSQQSRMPSSA